VWRERKKSEVETMEDAAASVANGARRTALGTLLVEQEYIDQHQLDEALQIGSDTGERLGEVIVRLGWVTEDDLAKVLAEQWSLRYFERSAISFDGRALRRMSHEDAERLEALPIQENDDGVVLVALAEPTEARIDALRTLLGDRIDFVVVAKTALETGLRSDLLSRSTSASDVVDTVEVEPAREAVGQFEQREHREPVWEDGPRGEATEAFDHVANAMRDALSAQVDALRAIVVESEATRQRDREQIARLEQELSERQRELDERTASVRAMQRTLRDYADALEVQP
jgi:Type II secretion system (T2SS), protein E, N-terminal domain